MIRAFFSLSLLIGVFLAGSHARMSHNDSPMWAMKDLVRQQAESGMPYHSFLNNSTMHCGVYALPAKAVDGQSPHDEDEVYYVYRGKAKIEIDDVSYDVVAGDVIFVAAKRVHRFVEIQEDLELLVFFSKATPRG